MVKCIHDKCCWPECDKTCGLVPTGDYVAGSSAEEGLILHLQNEIAELNARFHREDLVINNILLNLRSVSTAISSLHKLPLDYAPKCKFGYCDCVYDPAYIRKYYPDWWKDLGMPTSCDHCVDGERYDDEDK